MGNASGVSRGDRHRNAKLARLRELVPLRNAIVGDQRIGRDDHALTPSDYVRDL
jgi:hypothetical protein